jgi:uncharacterized integral membrane protein (TIGR00698 family)
MPIVAALDHAKEAGAWLRRIGPGIALSVIVGIAAMFIAERFNGPLLLFALLLGIAVNFASSEGVTPPGINFAMTHILRLAVALLGARISLVQVEGLGWTSILIVACAVVLTIGFGIAAARYLGLDRHFGIVSGGAVAICGASAAFAISAALPPGPNAERNTLIAVVGVTTLSTLAMIAYPAFALSMGWSERAMGFFLGATIHDVAQVVGAGYSISLDAGDFATFTKLTRVVLLVPVVATVSLVYRAKVIGGKATALPIPAFLVGFVLLMAANSAGLIPQGLASTLSRISQFCLVVAVAALGMKTSFKSLLTLGWRPILTILSETLFLALLVIGALLLE